MNKFSITAIKKSKNRISYAYEIEGEWKRYFDKEILFWSEYDHLVEYVPDSIAVLPLLGNIIVMASIFHAVIYTEEVDKDFYDSIELFLEGYQTFSPQIDFKKQQLVVAQRIVHNTRDSETKKSMLFFSGGVDAWSSLLAHLEEKPLLVSIWGADIAFDNEKAWIRAKNNNREIADSYQLDFITIHSTLRRFINEKELNNYCMEIVRDNWWSAFQHSIGMMCLAAPITYGEITRLYFASTYSEKDEKCEYVTASDPLIDNHVSFAGCKVFHDGYEYSRHDKVRRICSYSRTSKAPVKIRVCYKSVEGDNCCQCEKCCNTILSIIIEGYLPEDFGFPYERALLPSYVSSGMQELAKEEKYVFLSTYQHLQTQYRKKYEIKDVPKELRLLYSADIHELADFLYAPCRSCLVKEEQLRYMDELSQGKEWLEEQYHSLRKRLQEVDEDWARKNEWIAKLEKDILWLKQINHGLIKENERLQLFKNRFSSHKYVSKLKKLLKHL